MLQLTEEQFTKDLLLNTVSKEDLYRLGLRFVHLHVTAMVILFELSYQAIVLSESIAIVLFDR